MQQMNQKNSKNMNSFSTNADGVSAVVGVILMVAVTVILAAIIAAFFFGMTDNIPAAPGFAGFDVQRITNGSDADGTDIQVIEIQTVSIADNLDKISIKLDGYNTITTFSTANLLEVGGKVTLDSTSCTQTTEGDYGVISGDVQTVTITGKTTDGKTVMLYETKI